MLLLAGSVVVGVAAGAGAWFGDHERVAAYWVGAEVAEDGSARVLEVIEYDFGRAKHHGIFRDIPDLAADASVSVSSPTAPDDVLVSPVGNGARIRIGDPEVKISGRHRYSLSYQLQSVVDDGRLAWDAAGTRWDVPLERVSVHVVAPFELLAPECFEGELRSTRDCDLRAPQAGRLEAEVEGLASFEGVSVAADRGAPAARPRLPPPPAGAVQEPSRSRLAGLAVGSAFAAGLVTILLIRLAGREQVRPGGPADVAWPSANGRRRRMDSRHLRALATVEFSPPAELAPPEGGILLTESVADQHKSAWLIQAAVEGYIDLQQGPFGVTLVRRNRVKGPKSAILGTAFASRPSLNLGHPDIWFGEAWEDLHGDLLWWQESSGLWDPRGERNRRWVGGASPVAVLPALALTAVAAAGTNAGGSGWLAWTATAAAIAGIAWAAAATAWELRILTPRGSGLWLRVESFRRFLAASEAGHAREAAQRGVLREYTAWAVALGELDHWSRAVHAAQEAIPDPLALRDLDLAPSLSSSAFHTAAPPPPPPSSDGGFWSSSSGGGGGGGGGGVGGGAGGGGGGSW